MVSSDTDYIRNYGYITHTVASGTLVTLDSTIVLVPMVISDASCKSVKSEIET